MVSRWLQTLSRERLPRRPLQVFQLVGGGGSHDEADEEDEDEEAGVARELLEAAEAGEQELVRNLLANPDADVNRGVLGVTPLMVAGQGSAGGGVQG